MSGITAQALSAQFMPDLGLFGCLFIFKFIHIYDKYKYMTRI